MVARLEGITVAEVVRRIESGHYAPEYTRAVPDDSVESNHIM